MVGVNAEDTPSKIYSKRNEGGESGKLLLEDHLKTPATGRSGEGNTGKVVIREARRRKGQWISGKSRTEKKKFLQMREKGGNSERDA